MVKAGALRKRYIACRIHPADGTANESEIKKGIYNEALKFFGEYLLSYVALKFVSYKDSIAILRCNREFYPETLGFLAMVNYLNGKKVRTIAVATSGTIKALERKLSPSS